VSFKGSAIAVRDLLNVYAYCDGNHDLFTIAETLNLPFDECLLTASILAARGLIAPIDSANC
jgi:aminopeptidase-like protein